MFCILSMVPYGRWKRSTIVTSCTPTGSQDTRDGGDWLGARVGTYVTGKVLLAAEEGFVPRQPGLEGTLDLLHECSVGLEAHEPASHNPMSVLQSLTWMKARTLTA